MNQSALGDQQEHYATILYWISIVITNVNVFAMFITKNDPRELGGGTKKLLLLRRMTAFSVYFAMWWA